VRPPLHRHGVTSPAGASRAAGAGPGSRSAGSAETCR
jgi:hypothetical protein